MATIVAQNLVSRAATILQDSTNTRWPEDELLDWLNDGQREVVLYKPDANPKTETVSLVAGTKQGIPAYGLSLLDVIRNVDGGSPGRATRIIERRVMDEQLPDWHHETPASEVKHYVFDERNPKVFWVYPPNNGSGEVDVLFSSAPTDIALSDTLGVDDIYANALVDYMLYRAYLKDADYAANDQRSANQYERFMAAVGGLDTRESMDNPHVRRTRPVVGGE